VTQSKRYIPVKLVTITCHNTTFIVKALFFAVPADSPASLTGRSNAEENRLPFFCSKQVGAICINLTYNLQAKPVVAAKVRGQDTNISCQREIDDHAIALCCAERPKVSCCFVFGMVHFSSWQK